MARPSTLTDNQIKRIQDESYMGMIDKYWVMNEFNVSMKTAERVIKKLGLMHTKQSNIDIIRRYMNGEQPTRLIAEYGMSQPNFNALLRRRGIEARHTQYTADFHYFDKIDTEAKAYFLGFIYADGCLYRNTLKISLNEKDIDILEKLKQEMKSNHPIRYTNATGSFAGGPIVTLEISHKYIREAMLKHGVVENKTHRLEKIPDTVPEELIKHFIRGYMDGDGSFSNYELQTGKRAGDMKYSFSLVGTESFLENIRYWINQFSPVEITAQLQDRHPERETNIRQLRTSGKKQVLVLLDWLYEGATIYLNRKYEKYRQLPR